MAIELGLALLFSYSIYYLYATSRSRALKMLAVIFAICVAYPLYKTLSLFFTLILPFETGVQRFNEAHGLDCSHPVIGYTVKVFFISLFFFMLACQLS